MEALLALGRLYVPLANKVGDETAAALLDGICEADTNTELEISTAWVAHDYGLLHVIDSGEVAQTQRAMAA